MTNEMTAEEAVKIIKEQQAEFNEKWVDYGRVNKAYNKAIQALEAQPSEEDFVKHKKEVLERIAKREREIDKYIKELEALEQQPTDAKTYLKRREENYVEYNVEWFLKNWELELEILSGGKIKPTDANCISREAVQDLISRWLSDYLLDETREVLETINYKVGDMPSVIPQRPKGEWIKEKDCLLVYRCSNCKKFVYSRESESDEKFEDLSRLDSYKYCPRCGAYMGGGEDETSD